MVLDNIRIKHRNTNLYLIFNRKPLTMKKIIILACILMSFQAKSQYYSQYPNFQQGQQPSSYQANPYAPFSSAVPSDASNPATHNQNPQGDYSRYVESARSYFQSSGYHNNQWWTAPWTSFTGWMVNQFYNGYNQQELDRVRAYVEDPYFQTMFDQINTNKHNENLWNEFFNELEFGHPGPETRGNNPNNMVNPNVPVGSSDVIFLFAIPYLLILIKRHNKKQTI